MLIRSGCVNCELPTELNTSTMIYAIAKGCICASSKYFVFNSRCLHNPYFITHF